MSSRTVVRIAGAAAIVIALLALLSGCLGKESGKDRWSVSVAATVKSDTAPFPVRPGVQVQFDFDKVDRKQSHELIPHTGIRNYEDSGQFGDAFGFAEYDLGYANGMYYEGIRAIASVTYRGQTDADTLYEDDLFRPENELYEWRPSCILHVHDGAR